MTTDVTKPALLILNQMAGPMTWELAEDLGEAFGCVALLTGHSDTLQKKHPKVLLFESIPYERGSFLRRALTWLRYCWQAIWWIYRWPRDIPILLFSNPPFLVWLGWLMACLRKQTYAVMVHDIYPDVLVRTSIFSANHPLMAIWRWLNRIAYQQAAVVMTLGDYMAETLEHQFNAAKTTAGQIVSIPPWVDTDIIKPMPKEENWFARKHNQVGKLTVMYSGNMGLGHDIETMVEAARHLRDRADIHFMFIGAGPKWTLVEDAITHEELSNVTLLGWQSEETIPFSLATADVAFVSLEEAFEGIMVPSKGGYSLAVGALIYLISSGHNELASWINTWQLGSIIKINDASSLSKQICDFAQNQLNKATVHEHCREVAVQKFSRTACTASMIHLIEKQVNITPSTTSLM